MTPQKSFSFLNEVPIFGTTVRERGGGPGLKLTNAQSKKQGYCLRCGWPKEPERKKADFCLTCQKAIAGL